MASVINYYTHLPKKYKSKQRTYASYPEYHISIPNRILVVGSAGSGKTNVSLNMILGMSCWTRIYLIAKHPEETLYAFLTDQIREVEKHLEREILTVSNSLDDLPELDKMNEREMSLVLIDDMVNEKSKDLEKVANFWTRGRHMGVSTIFISQSFFKTPKLIRSNTDIVIFKRLTKRDLTMVMSEFSLDKDPSDLMRMYKECHTGEVDNFFMIDSSSGQAPEYMYRHNFDPIE